LPGAQAMTDRICPVRWIDRRAVMTFPGQVDASNAHEIREQLLAVVGQGADELIVDLSTTVSCDRAAADVVAHGYQRALLNGTQLRLVVPAEAVRHTLSAGGLDRLVSIYPSLGKALTAGAPDMDDVLRGDIGAVADGQAPVREQDVAAGGIITPGVLWKLIDALSDGVALTDESGLIVLANRRLEEIFGYRRGELTGQPIDTLVPADLRAAHERHRAGYLQAPRARLMGAGARLVGLRKDGATLPVEISLSPVPTATGQFTLAVVRESIGARSREDLIGLARAAVAEQAHRSRELLDRVVSNLFQVGNSIQAAIDQPHDVAGERITEALRRMDDTIHEIRDHVFAAGGAEHDLPGE
jgi:anti-anti-sigma factor